MSVFLNQAKFLLTREIGNKSRFSFVIALLVGIILLSPYFLLLKIQFWMLDDHAFIYWDSLRTDSALQNVIGWLHLTNFFNYGETDRFFPIQNLLKVNQVQFLGMDSVKWFAMNLSLVVLSFGLAVSLVNHSIKLIFGSISNKQRVLSVFLSLIFILNPTVAGIYSRLGTSEQFTIPLITFIALCAIKTRLEEKPRLAEFFLVFSCFLVAGMKENFISWGFLGALYCFIRFLFSKKAIYIMVSIFMTGWTIFLLMGVLPTLLKTGRDSYGQAIDRVTIFNGLINSLTLPYSKIVVAFSILIVILSRFTLKRDQNLIVVLAFTNLCFLLNDLFLYRGNIQGHYQANSILSAWFSVVLFSVVFLYAIQSSPFRDLIFAGGLVLLLIISFSLQKEARNVIQKQVVSTASFQSGIDSIERVYIKNGPDTNLIFVAQLGWDYEAIVSVSRYIHARLPDAKFYLKEVLSEDDALKKVFSQISTAGSEEWQINKISRRAQAGANICIYSQELRVEPMTDCDQVKVITWLS